MLLTGEKNFSTETPFCLHGHRTRVTACRCDDHWTGPSCDLIDCGGVSGGGRVNSDGVSCSCPFDLTGLFCHYKICRLRSKSNATYCYPVDGASIPLYAECFVENRTFYDNRHLPRIRGAGAADDKVLEYCTCFRGKESEVDGRCECRDDFRGQLCELRPGFMREYLYFDADGKMTKNSSIDAIFTPGQSAAAALPWASPFTLFTIFILFTVFLVACFRQRNSQWRVDSVRLRAMQITLFRHPTEVPTSIEDPFRRNRRTSTGRFRMIFDGGSFARQPRCSTFDGRGDARAEQPMLAPTTATLKLLDKPPPYEEVVGCPPPYVEGRRDA